VQLVLTRSEGAERMLVVRGSGCHDEDFFVEVDIVEAKAVGTRR